MPTYSEAPQGVIDLGREIIDLYHPWLSSADIGFLMVEDMPLKRGRTVYGTARRVQPIMKNYIDLDFIICLNFDVWPELSALQRRALLDHELSHCSRTEKGEFCMVDHDLTEFLHIVKRYGIWYPHGERVFDALQPHLPNIEAWLRNNGSVRTVTTVELTRFNRDAPDPTFDDPEPNADPEIEPADDYNLDDDLADILSKKDEGPTQDDHTGDQEQG